MWCVDMAGHHEAERQDGERIAAGGAAPCPGLGLQVAEEVDAGRAGLAEFLDVGGPGETVGSAPATAMFWSKLGSGVSKPRANQSARIDEDALRVIEVAEHLTDAPLFRRVAVEGCLFGDAGEEGECLLELRGHGGEAVIAFHLVDVCEVVGAASPAQGGRSWLLRVARSACLRQCRNGTCFSQGVAGCTKPYAGGKMPPTESQTEVAPLSTYRERIRHPRQRRRAAAQPDRSLCRARRRPRGAGLRDGEVFAVRRCR